MMGLRKTTGSQDVPYPNPVTLIHSFNKPHTVLTDEQRQKLRNPPSKLSVGARALAKHSHRSSEGFWGVCKGKETEKNEIANQKAEQIISQCVWVNVHILPHSEIIVECREEQGYGIRWAINGDFRGFLEPQMAGGHEKKWRH